MHEIKEIMSRLDRTDFQKLKDLLLSVKMQINCEDAAIRECNKSSLLNAEKDVGNALRILEDIKNCEIKIDSKKVASKYIEYVKRKEKINEKPLSSGDWLWHTIDLLNIGELLKD